MTTLHVVLKVTGRCNLACTYCNIFFGPDSTIYAQPARASPSVANDLGVFLEEALSSGRVTSARVVLHGGEPLLLGRESFEAACRAIRRGRSLSERALTISVQTNAVLVDSLWIDVFERQRIHVGVSVDGLPDVHNARRIDKRGKGSFDRTLRGIRNLQSAASQGRIAEIGALTVWSPALVARDYYRFMVNELGLLRFDVLLPDYTHDTMRPESKDGLSTFLGQLARCWLSDDTPNVLIRLVSSVTLMLLLQHQSLLLHFGNSQGLALTVDPNGMLRLDDSLRSCGNRFTELGIPLHGARLADVLNSPIYGALVADLQKPADNCLDCRWLTMCQSGQPLHRYRAGSFNNPSVYCDELKVLFSTLYHELSSKGHIASDNHDRNGGGLDYGKNQPRHHQR
jgi:uncharacterized protein